jgi:hypothetical protein
MQPLILQPLATFNAPAVDTEIVQSSFFYLDTTEYENIVFWAEVIEVHLGGAASVEINYETEPNPTGTAQVLFTNMIAPITLVVTPPITPNKILMAQNPLVPVGARTRFRLTRTGVAVGVWGVTIAVYACAS